MAIKALLTDLTWRTEGQQLAVMPEVAHVYHGIEGRSLLLRPTSRKEPAIFYVASIACLSDDEDDLIDFLRAAKKRDVRIICIEENFEWYPQRSLSIVLKAWKLARNNGAARVGGQISAAKREAIARAGAAKIKDRWPLPNAAWRTEDLLKEGELSRTSANKYLGRRPLAQAACEAAQKRKAKREERANA